MHTACPNCGQDDEIEDHYLVFAHAPVYILTDGSLNYWTGGSEVHWDCQRPYEDEALADGGHSLYCQHCNHSWTHIEPKPTVPGD